MAKSSLSARKPPTNTTIKFVCSYGGKILPRQPDGKLRYCGGETRVISVDRSISFSELTTKLGELCESSVTLRCQLPTEDLDALISITCDEDLVNLIEEYDQTDSIQSLSNVKIRAFLSVPKKPSPVSSPRAPNHCIQHTIKPTKKHAFRFDKSARNLLRYACENSSQSYQLVHNGSYLQ